jgi:molybdenum cofactor biosynthesis enzyme MoaA
MKNRNNKEISELLKNYHKKGIFLDIFEIEDINNLNDKQIVNILWNNNYKKIFKDDFFKDMYNSIYIR